MCLFSNYFPDSPHNLPQYTHTETRAVFFILLSYQHKCWVWKKQDKSRKFTMIVQNCLEIAGLLCAACLLHLILQVKQIWKTICNIKASLVAGLPPKYTANGFSPQLLHWEKRENLGLVSSYTVSFSYDKIFFNRKGKLEELVKIITRLPAFLCFCVCVCGSSTGAFIHASIYLNHTWSNVWPSAA